MDLSKISDMALQVLSPFLVIIVGILVGYAAKYVKKGLDYLELKAELIENEKVRALVKAALEDLELLLTNEILTTGEELKKEILEASEDGKLTTEEGVEIASKVANKVISEMSEDMIELLEKQYGSVESMVLGILQSKYEELKKEEKVD